MFVVVCYDIPDNRRRSRVANTLKGFGTRVQKSVFECDVSSQHFDRMKQRLAKLLEDGDGLRYYVLCGRCIGEVEVAGGPPVTRTPPYFAV